MNQILQDFIGKYKEKVDLEIARELSKRLEEVKEISPHLVPVLEAMQELSVGGKRLRAILTILGYEMSGQVVNAEVIKAGVVVEIFHLGLLIQDDFMDRGMTRRGVATLIARYENEHTGNFISMLAGDYTFGWGIEILSSLDLPTTHLNNAFKVWGKYFTRVGYGQTLDGLDIADDETILKILAIKSGEYSCVLPLLMGATLAGADEATIEGLERYGMEIGWVFQLRDDWIGYAKDMAKVGKKTYATMYGRDKTVEAIEDHMSKARSLVSGFGDLSGDARKVCEEMVTWLGTREN